MTNTVTNSTFGKRTGSELQDGFDSTYEKGEKIASDIKGSLSDLGKSLRQNGEDVLKDVEVKAHEAYDKMYDAGKKVGERIVKSIEESPLTSALIAFGIGTLLGLRLRKS